MSTGMIAGACRHLVYGPLGGNRGTLAAHRCRSRASPACAVGERRFVGELAVSSGASVPVPSGSSLYQGHRANAITHSGSGQQVLCLRRAAFYALKEEGYILASCGTKKRRTQPPPYSHTKGPSALAGAEKHCPWRQFVVYLLGPRDMPLAQES
jgi:hypothetical protein